MSIKTSLAEPAREWITRCVASGAWPDEEAYLNELVERDHEDAMKLAAFNAAIDEGLASGICELTFEQVIAAARARHMHAAD